MCFGFSMLHNAYIDEWLSIAFVPFIKQTFNTENNYYDIAMLNLKKVNFRLLPISESVLAMDRQHAAVRTAFDRAHQDTASFEIDRLLLLDTYASSFGTFIESQRMLLERAIHDIGGTPPAIPASMMDNSIMLPRTSSIMAGTRSRIQSASIGGPLTLLWTEFMRLLGKIDDPSEREFYYDSTVSNVAPSIFEWRVMLANSQKIINEDKKVKKNPFTLGQYDHNSASFVTSPISIAGGASSSSTSSSISPSSLSSDLLGLDLVDQSSTTPPNRHSPPNSNHASTTIDPLMNSIKGIPSGGIIKQGWMRKRGNKVKSWKRRYFILDMNRTVLYYDYPKEKNTANSANVEPTIMTPQMTTSSSYHENMDSLTGGGMGGAAGDRQSVYQYEHLKYKGSIGLHTAIVVAIKPNNCNINVNMNHDTTATNSKVDNDSYFGIDIRTPKRVWQLCCDSSKSMEEWLLALKGALK
eukprot:gene16993-20223_t